MDQIGFPRQFKNVPIKIRHIYRKDENGCFGFFGLDLSKMDHTWSKWISHQSKNVTIKICHVYSKDKNGSNLIKLDQIGFPHQSKNVTIKSSHIYRKDKNGCFVFDFFGSDLSKMDQTWSNLIKLDFLTNLKVLV